MLILRLSLPELRMVIAFLPRMTSVSNYVLTLKLPTTKLVKYLEKAPEVLSDTLSMLTCAKKINARLSISRRTGLPMPLEDTLTNGVDGNGFYGFDGTRYGDAFYENV